MEIFAVFNDGLSKSTMAAMADGITSTGDLLLYVLDRLFDSFSDESLSDIDDRNNDDVGKLYIGIQLQKRLNHGGHLGLLDTMTTKRKMIWLIILADYHTFRIYIIFLLIKCIFVAEILT